MYSLLCKATGRYVENKKSFYFAWKWEYKGGKWVIKNINAEIKINNTIIKQTLINNAIRILGVYISLSLN